MIEIVFWLLAGCIAYTYVGFPVLAGLAARWRPRPVRKGECTPRISLLIVAHNEARVIAERLANARASEYPPDRLQVVVASDGSTDDTVALARAADPAAVVLDLPRTGKARALNRGAQACDGEILVFSDANAMYERSALRALAGNFADPEVGGVCGNMRTRAHGETLSGGGETSYWEYDKWLKRQESALGSIVSADGSIYAVRRSLFRPVEDFVTDDFMISVRVVEAGYRLVYEPEAVSWEPVLLRPRDQLKRRVRIVEAALRGMFLVRGLMNPFRFGTYALVLVSHKLLRRMVPLMLLLLLVVNLGLWDEGSAYRLALLAQGAVYGAALLGLVLERAGRSPRLLRFPFYFCLGNWGTLLGWYYALRYTRRETFWEPIRD
jgi:cellulose synthase/poly-beta-1,6-N-acetylglucosamine synthase-like glycosyltransferase